MGQVFWGIDGSLGCDMHAVLSKDGSDADTLFYARPYEGSMGIRLASAYF